MKAADEEPNHRIHLFQVSATDYPDAKPQVHVSGKHYNNAL